MMAPREVRRVEVRLLAEEAVRVFYKHNKIQPEFVLRASRLQDGELYWLTDLRPGVYGAGPRVAVEAWPADTRHWYTMATRTRTCDELTCLLIEAALELARGGGAGGVQWVHEGEPLTPPRKVLTRTVRPIPTPHMMFPDDSGEIHEMYMDDLRRGALAFMHSFVCFDCLDGGTGLPVYLDLSYAQFGNRSEFYLGGDATLNGKCHAHHETAPHVIPSGGMGSTVPVIPMPAAIRELVAAVGRAAP